MNDLFAVIARYRKVKHVYTTTHMDVYPHVCFIPSVPMYCKGDCTTEKHFSAGRYCRYVRI